jgi:hypothetical protein
VGNPKVQFVFFHDGHLWLTCHKKEIQTLDSPRIYIYIYIYIYKIYLLLIFKNLLLWAGYIGYKSIISARDVGSSEALLGIHWEQHKIQHPTLLLQRRKTWAPWLAHLIGCKNVFLGYLCSLPFLALANSRGMNYASKYSPTMGVNVST